MQLKVDICKMQKNNILSDCRDILLLAVGNARHNGDWNYGPINSCFTRVYYVYEGRATVHINGRMMELLPDHLYIIPPFVTHIDRCDGVFGHYYVHFLDKDHRLLHLYSNYDLPFEIGSSLFDRQVIERLCELCADMYIRDSHPETYENDIQIQNVIAKYNALSEFNKIEIYSLLLTLITRFLEKSSKKNGIKDDRIKRTLQTIGSEISLPISIDRLANGVALGKDRFIRLFKQEVGETPVRYIMKQKIERAQILLTSSDMRIKEIAYSLGFTSEAYFDRVFLLYVHLSPTDFRRQNYTV